MTEHIRTYLTCDGPSSNHTLPWDGEYEGPAAEALEQGWIVRDGKHYCPECAEEVGNG
jgi:hypothetical protein